MHPTERVILTVPDGQGGTRVYFAEHIVWGVGATPDEAWESFRRLSAAMQRDGVRALQTGRATERWTVGALHYYGYAEPMRLELVERR